MSILPACRYVYHMCAVPGGGKEKVLYLVEVDLQVVVSCHVGVGN